MSPLAFDLYAGLGGWTEGLLAAGYEVLGFDVERHVYGPLRYPGQLVLQDVRTIDGARLADAALIVASPPCQKYSYMAMPWGRAKELQRWYRDPEHRERIAELNELFDACFRIRREASEAAGRRIPLVVENVCGAQPWVGKSRWRYGSYHLWGDVPALMPHVSTRRMKMPSGCAPRRWSDREVPKDSTPNLLHRNGIKQGGDWFNAAQPSMSRCCSSKSTARKVASALIAKIPFELAWHIGRVYAARHADEEMERWEREAHDA